MTIFVSQRPNHDPEPRTDDLPGAPFDPRPEFDQTRDPLPWRNRITGTRYPDRLVASSITGQNSPGDLYNWDARHELFDPPVNRILARFRENLFGNVKEAAPFWIDWIEDDERWTPEETAHARKVLTRLVTLTNDENGWRIQK